MPGCAAIGCNNRSEKGYTMKCFPRDPFLRNIWKKKVGRVNWEPSKNAFLCHMHFTKNQWLPTSNGKIKLKKGAMPSIFTVTSTRKSQKKKYQLEKSHDLSDLDGFEIEYLDSSDPVILELANKKTIPNIIRVQSQSPEISGQILQNVSILSGEALKNFQNENIIIVADENNREIGKIIKDNAFMVLEDVPNKENIQVQAKPERSTSTVSSDLKIEVKEEVQENSMLHAVDFDALERKLQAICDGDNSSTSKISCTKNNDLSVERESSFSVEELDVSDNEKNSLSQDIDSDTPLLLRLEKKHEKKVKDLSLNQEVAEASSNTNDAHVDSNVRGINNSEVKDTDERKVPTKKQAPIVKSNQTTAASKIIIKNDVDLSKENLISSLMLVPVHRESINSKQPSVSSSKNTNILKSNKDQLAAKVEVQTEVIQKLRDQLMMYKDMEIRIKNMTQELNVKDKEIKALKNKAQNDKLAEKTKFDFHLENLNKMDLIDRLRDLENQLKSLAKSNNEEIKNRRQLECKIRHKDNNIKELNWKLEKASKILDRSEKNTKNYKKRMYEMRTILKKHQLLGEKNSIFEKLYSCNVEKNFSDELKKAAWEIKEACGLEGYKKLLDCDFPLPDLSFLNEIHLRQKQTNTIISSKIVDSKSKPIDSESELVDMDGEFFENTAKRIIDEDNKPIDDNNQSTEVVCELITLYNNENESFNTFNETAAECNDETVEFNVNIENIINNEDDVKMENVEYLDPEFLKKSSDTMVQTVQDIFDECSDGEDLIELKKHLMKEIDTDAT